MRKNTSFTETKAAAVSLVGHLFTTNSLALSLPNFTSSVTLSPHQGSKDTWKISNTERLAYQSIDQFLKHLVFVKKTMNYQGGFFVQSSNNFPMGFGLSSAVSSYSALTACAVKAIEALQNEGISKIDNDTLALLSGHNKAAARHAFYGPWSVRDQDSMLSASFKDFDNLKHVALVVDTHKKRLTVEQVLSLIEKNPNTIDYTKQIRERILHACTLLQEGDWHLLFHCIWDDFIERHQLFHTSKPSFSFQSEECKRVLKQVRHWWDIYDDGPLVTMGLGNVIHLFFRPDQAKMQRKMLTTLKYLHALSGTCSGVTA